MKVNTNWNLANFSVSLSVEANEALQKTLMEYGVRYFGQRNSEVDKILGGFETVNGKSKRKANWKRSEVAYTAELAQALAKSFEKLSGPDELVIPAEVEISEYVREDKVDSKFTEEKEIVGRHESADDLETWLVDKVKYTGDTHGDDGEYAIEMLRAVRAFKIARLRELAAGM